jgi:hypothetical protein
MCSVSALKNICMYIVNQNILSECICWFTASGRMINYWRNAVFIDFFMCYERYILYINCIFYRNSFQASVITQNCSVVPREPSLVPQKFRSILLLVVRKYKSKVKMGQMLILIWTFLKVLELTIFVNGYNMHACTKKKKTGIISANIRLGCQCHHDWYFPHGWL